MTWLEIISLLGMHEVGHIFSLSHGFRSVVSMVFCWGMNFCYPELSGPVGVALKWTETKAADQWHTALWRDSARSSVLLDVAHAGPALTQHPAASWLPAYTASFHPSPGEDRGPYPHFTEEETEAWKFREKPQITQARYLLASASHSVFMVNFSACMTLIITYKFSSK